MTPIPAIEYLETLAGLVAYLLLVAGLCWFPQTRERGAMKPDGGRMKRLRRLTREGRA